MLVYFFGFVFRRTAMKKFLQLLIMVWLVLSLPVITATTSNTKQGHFVFSKGSQDITQLSLKPGDSGTFTIKNTGTADISDFWVNHSPSTVNILNNNGIGAGAIPCPLKQNAKKTLIAKKSCEVGYSVLDNAGPEYLTLIPFGDGADNSSTAMLKINISTLGHAVFRNNNQQITHLDLKPGDTTTFELYNAGGAAITDLRLLGLPSGMTFDSKCSGQSASLPVGNSCTIAYNVRGDAKKNTFNLTVTGDPSSSDNSGSAVLTINIIPANTGHFVFLNSQGQHIDSLYLQPGDSGSIKLHNAGNAEITDVKLQGLSQNIYMNCPNTHVTQNEPKNFNTTSVGYGFMYQTQDGTIYVGTQRKGLTKLNAARDGLDDVDKNAAVEYGFMYQTQDGTIYVGTHDKGLKKIGADGKSLVKVNNNIDVQFGFMYQTQDGTIYVGTHDKGLKKIGADGKSLVQVNNTDVGYGFIYQTRDGTIYVGTKHNGLKKLGADGKSLVNLDDSINGDGISVLDDFMYQTQDGTIFVGTVGGLKKLNAAKNGLVDANLMNVDGGFMYQTRDGTIFLGTVRSLKKLNPDGSDLKVNKYGLYSHGFMYQTRDGTIYVGTNYQGLEKLPYTVNRTLASNSECTINYFIPKGITIKKTSVLTAYGDNADNSGMATLPVTISPADSQGHFVFENGNGKSITNLDLKPGDSGTILLRNVGKTDIKSVKLHGLLAPDPLHFVSKCLPSGQNQPSISLNSGDSCTFSYSVKNGSSNTKFMLSPTGVDADNNGTARLTVNVSSTGHFVFRDTAGNSVNKPYLKPGDTGTVVLHNTGQANIINFNLIPTSSTIISQTSSTCFSANTLKTGGSCTIDYAVPAVASAIKETFTLTAKGTNADNNGTAKLPVTVSKEANLVFRNLSGQVITHLDLNVGQNTGTILLQNTGGTAVTNLTQTGLPSATMGTCFLKFGGTYLGPGSSCSMNYGPLTTASSVTLTATGYISGRPVTAMLTISVTDYNKGHFAFSKDGQDIAQLRLKPGDSVTFTVQNTGTADISDFWVNQLPSTTGSILNNSSVSANPCPLNQNAKTTLTAKTSCEVGYSIPSNADPDYLTLIPLGDGADNSSTAMLKINISKLGHAIFRQNNQQITHLDLNPGDKTTFELYNAGGAAITHLRLLGLPFGMTFDSKCSGQSASLPVGNSCTITYNVPNDAKKNIFTLTATGNPYSSDNNGSAVLTINIIPANTGHFVFLNNQGQHIDSLRLQPGDSGSIQLHNAGNIDITDVRLQGVSQNIYMNCPNTHVVTQNELQHFNKTNVFSGFMYQTRDRTVYVGTAVEGLYKLNAARNGLEPVEANKTTKTNVSYGFMYQTRDGTIYIGTREEGLKKLNAARDGLEPVESNETIKTSVLSGFMYQTRDGTIYVGAYDKGLKKLNAARDGLEPVEANKTKKTSVIFGFMYQTRDGTIYVGTEKEGLKKLNAARDGLEPVEANKTKKTSVMYGFMYQTWDGTIYVGTEKEGLKKLNAARDGLEPVEANKTKKTSVRSGFMYQTRDGTIYVGTEKEGLKKLNAARDGLEPVDGTDVHGGFMYQTRDGTIYVGAYYKHGLKKLPQTVNRTLTQSSDFNSDCTINYFIPKGITIKKTSVLTVYGDNADNSGMAELPVTISSADSQGHFVFENGNGKSITNLDLKPGDSGTVLLRNVGKADIGNVKLDGLLASAPPHFVSKCLPSGQNQPLISLKSGDSCTFFYSVANGSPNTKFALSPTGINADNNGTARLTVNVSSNGHFVFRNTAGNNVNKLYLKPGDTGMVVLHNTGQADITNLTLKPTGKTIISQTSSTCFSANTLKTGGSCTIDYAVPAAVSAAETFTLTAKGTNADNNGTAKLPVTISKEANLVFRNLSGQVITHLDLNVGQNTGTILLQNTGGTAVTNLTQTGLPLATMGTCFLKFGGTYLGPGSSCSMNYGPFNIAYPVTLTAIGHISGKTVTTTLIINIYAEKGHFVFSKDGHSITQLSLKPGDSRTFTVRNYGIVDISDFWVNQLPSTVNILNNNGVGASASASSCPLNQNAKTTLTAKTSCEVGYKVPPNADPDYLTLIPFGDGADNSSTAMLKINISRVGHAIFRKNKQQITHLDLKPGDQTTFELYNAGGAAITDLRLLGLPSGMTFDSKCSGQSASLPVGNSCTITYNVPNDAKKNIFTLTATGNPYSSDNSGSAVLTINIIPANTVHFVFLNNQGQHIDSLRLQPGDSGSIQLHNAGNTKITDVRLQGVSQNIYMNCPNTHVVTQNELQNFNKTKVSFGFMYQTRDGTIYVGTREEGLKKLGADGKSLQDVETNKTKKTQVWTGFMYQTRDGTIYVGTREEGLKKLNAERDGLEPVEANKTTKTNVQHGFMYQTRDGTIYVGTTSEGLKKLNAARDGLEPVEANKTKKTNVSAGFMYQTRDGTIYVGTHNEGLKKLNAARDGLEPVEAKKTSVVFGFMYQTRDGTVYVGTSQQNGLKKLNAARDGLEPVEAKKTAVALGFMYQTRDGTIYVGTTGEGLKKLNAARDGLEPVEAKTIKTSVQAGFMYQTLDGTVYVGTDQNGLKKLLYTVNRTLASGFSSDCTINYFIPKGITIKKTSVLTAYGDNADNSGMAALPVTISPADSQGHFVFENSNGKSITNLDLKPGDSGVVLLRNVGKADIGNVKLDGLLASAPPHFVSKCLPSGQNQPLISLKSGDSCTFFYSVANGSPNTKFALSPTGINADNNGTARLTVNVSSNGHFVFRNTAGNNVNKLYLKPDDTGVVVLHNTGQTDITNLTLKPTGKTIISQTSSTCFSANTLKTGGSCTIDYAVPAAVSAAETFTLTAKGTNADNNGTAELPVTVSKEANLVFRNLSGQVITHLDLNVGQNTGTILLQNTGGTAVTNLTQTGLPPVTIGTCFLKFGGTYLGPGSSCSMHYGPFNIAYPVTLTAIGHISGKTVTATLIINTYAEKGHFVFSKDGHSITQLSLKPDDSGTFTVQNNGIVDISDFWVNQLSSTVNILNNNGVGASASPCPLNKNAKKTLTARTSCEVGYKVPPNADPDYLTLIPLGDGADNSSTAMLKINISKLGHAIFRQKNQQITHLDLKPGDATTFELYNAGGAAITDLRLLGLPPGMTFDSKCSGQSASLPVGNSCTITYNVRSDAKKNNFTLTVTGDPSSSDNSGSAVLTINIIPANTGHFVFLNGQGQHIDSLYLQPGDSGSIKLHNAGNAEITDVKLQGLSQNIYMNCPNTHVTQNELKDFNTTKVGHGFMYQTQDGTIYVGTSHKGLKKLGADGKSLVPVNNINVEFGFMYQTQDGTIYVGTDNKGLKKLDADGKSLVPVNNTSVTFGFMYQTQDGTIYVGTSQKGLQKLDADGKSLVPVNNASVSWGFMYQTRDGTIYVGTYKHGLKKLGADGKSLVNLDDSINGDGIHVRDEFMYQTQDGTIFVGTGEGLKKFNAAKNGVVGANLMNVDGGFMYQTRDGTIFLGTVGSLKELNPDGSDLKVNTGKYSHGFMYQTRDGTIYVGTTIEGLKKLLYTVNRTLASNSGCTINYFIPKGITIKKTSFLTAYGNNADNSGTAALPVTISPADSQGHFVFENSNGKSITNLDLKPGDSGVVLLRNVGKADILNVKLDGLLASAPPHFVSKCLPSGQNQPSISLKSGDSCTFFYSVANGSSNTKFALSPTGINADNNGTARLTVNVSSTGHFVFRDTAGNSVNKLYLKPGDTGTVVLHNTGQANIINFNLIPTSNTIISQTSSTCFSANTLKTGGSCTIDYAVPAVASAIKETFTLTAKGTNADNNGTAKLPVTVSKEANLVFRNLSGQVITHLDLNVGQNTGTILLQNTGGTAVTNLTQTGLPSATMGTCFLKFGGTYLGPGSSCSMNYGPLTTASPVTLTATGYISGRPVTAMLTISVTDYNKGHFAFSKDGQDIAQLRLKPGDSVTFTVQNTGTADISDFWVNQLPSTTGSILNNSSVSANPCPLNQNAKTTLTAKTSCEVGYSIPSNADPDYLTLIPLGDRADNSSTAMLKINISKLGHAIFRQNNQQITHLDLKPGDATTFELYNAGGAAITHLRLLGLPPGMTFDSKCSGQSASLPVGNSCTITYNVRSDAKKNTFTLTVTGDPSSSDNSGSAVLTINIIPANTGHFVFLNDQGQHIDSLYLNPGDSGSIQLHNARNIDITDVRLQGVSQNIYMNCPNTHVTQNELKDFIKTNVRFGFMYQTRDRTIYVGTTTDGLQKLNTARNGLEPVETNRTIKYNTKVRLGFVYQTRDGTVYVGTTAEGLQKLNAARDGVEPVEANETIKTSVAFGFMYQTRDGTIYVGTQNDGLEKLNAARDGLEPVEANKTKKTSVKSGFVYQTRDGTVYVGTTTEGLQKLNTARNGLEPVEANETIKTSVAFGFMYQTRDGTIYVGTKNDGLEKLNAARDGLEPVEANKTKKTSVGFGFMYQTRDGTIYVQTNSEGLKKLNAARDGLEPVEANETIKTSVAFGFMYQTRDGTIYAGTIAEGLKKLLYTVNRTLASNSDCTINYFIPKGITIKKTSFLTAYGDHADNSGMATLPVTINPADSQGHFVFENGNGKSITNLDLKPGDSGVVLLRNVGKADIGNVKLDGLLASAPPHFVSKCLPSGQNQPSISLKSGDSCTFFYSVANGSPNTKFALSPTGINADNNGTARLTVNVSSNGHFVFRNTAGNNVNKLYLKPDDKGTVVLHNTGQADITNLTLKPTGNTIISQTSSTCFSANTLKTGGSCTIDYAVPAAVSAAETFTMTAKGTNADNNDIELPVTVSKEANLVFRNLSGQVITHLDLNVGQNTGTILLQNTGGTAVTNLTQTGLPPVTIGTCFLKVGGTYLGPGSSCSMHYGPFNIAYPVTLTAIGHISGKTVTATLIINTYAEKGHFVFSKDGHSITQLSLKPDDSGTFTVQNNGIVDISDFWVNQLSSTVNILNNNGVGASASPCPLNQNAKKTLTAKTSCEVGYSIPSNADPDYLTLIPFGDGADNSSTAMLKINISRVGHAIFRKNKQQITHLDLKPGDQTTFELYNAGGAAITDLRLLGLPSGMTFDSKCSGQSASLPVGNSCTITYNVPNYAKKNIFTLTATDNPYSSDNSGSAVLTINIIPANTGQGHFVFLNNQGQHIDSLRLQPGDSGSIQLHNAGNTKITDVRLQGVSQNIYMNCPNTHVVTQNELQNFNKTKVSLGFMYQTRDGTIYVGTREESLKKLGADGKSLQDVETNKTKKTQVWTGFMYQTRDGTIYVGTASEGLKKLNAERDGLEPVEANKTKKTLVISGFMYQTRDGTIYVGTHNEGLKKLNAARDGLEPVEANKTKKTNVSAGFMYQTRDGTIYVGTHNEGLKKLNAARDGLEPVEANKTKKTSVVFGFMYQTWDGTVYVGTGQQNGLKKLNAARDGLEPVDAKKTAVALGFMYQTRDGKIYVGTTDEGLQKLNAARDGLEPVEAKTIKTSVKTGFMYQTLDGTVYVGTDH